MPDPLVQNLPLDQAAIHVDVAPGGEIVLRGSYDSTWDGSTVDAATTTWPGGHPPNETVDTGGLFEISEAYGLHLSSRDSVKHEVHAKATGEAGPSCAAFGVAAPCLVNRAQKQATSRLITTNEWGRSLKGAGLTLEVPATVLPPVPPSIVPYFEGTFAILAIGLVGYLGRRYRKRREASPAGQLVALGKRVREKLAHADAVVAAPLAPAIETALKALRAKRIDATSVEGKRIAMVLQRVEVRLDESAHRTRADQEQQAADELVQEFESALEAADEATLASKGG